MCKMASVLAPGLCEQGEDAACLLEVHRTLAPICFFLGEYVAARAEDELRKRMLFLPLRDLSLRSL